MIAAYQGLLCFDAPGTIPAPVRLLAACALVAGILLVAGFRTRSAAFLLGLGLAALWLSMLHLPARNLLDRPLALMLAETISAAVVLLGPGAYSVDARLYGRREIVIPRSVSD